MANEALGTCEVEVNGTRYRHMLSMNLRCSKQDRTASGTVVLSWPGDYGSQAQMAAPDFLSGAKGHIHLDGQLAATIRFDKRVSKGSPKNYELTLNFRGNQSLNIDSAVEHDSGQWNNETAVAIINSVKRPDTGELIDNSGGAGSEPIDRMIEADGESVERFSTRVAKVKGLTLWETPEGNWMLEKLKKEPGFAVMPAELRLAQSIGAGVGQLSLPVGGLALGRDFTQWQVAMDIRPQVGDLTTVGAGIPKDDEGKYGKPVEGILLSVARDSPFAKMGGRFMRELVDAPQDRQSLETRNEFSDTARTQQAVQVTLRMSTWSDRGGQLWRLGDKWHVNIPIDHVDDDLEIAAVEFELTKDSRSATLMLIGEATAKGIHSIFNVAAQQTYKDPDEEMRQERERSRQPIPPSPTSETTAGA